MKRILQIPLFFSVVVLPALEANWVTYEGAEISIQRVFADAGPDEVNLMSGSLYFAAEFDEGFSLISEFDSNLVEVGHTVVWNKDGHPFFPRYFPSSTITASFEPVRGEGHYFVSVDFDEREVVYNDFDTPVVEVKAAPVIWSPEFIHVSFQSDQVSPTYFEDTWMGWLAIFADVDNGWAYAGNLREWFYTRSTDASSVPFYTQSRGWQWTSETAFPYAYQFSTDEWVELQTY